MEMAIGRVRESEGQRRRGEDCMFIAEKEEDEEGGMQSLAYHSGERQGALRAFLHESIFPIITF